MKRTIWKYKLQTDSGHCEVHAPPGAKPILFGKQGIDFIVWMEIPDVYEETRQLYYFCVVGTGFDVPPDATHFQSFQDQHGYVWHLYVE